MSEENDNYFFVVLPSNVKEGYPENKSSKYRVHLPKPIRFQGSWLVGLYSIQYPRSFTTTSGTVDDQYIDLHRTDGRVQRLTLPRNSLNTIVALQNYINGNGQTQLVYVKRRIRKRETVAEYLQVQHDKDATTDKIFGISFDEMGEKPAKKWRPRNYGTVNQDGTFECSRIGRRYTCRRVRPAEQVSFYNDPKDKQEEEGKQETKQESVEQLSDMTAIAQTAEALPLTKGQQLIKRLRESKKASATSETAKDVEIKPTDNAQATPPTTEDIPQPKTKGQQLKERLKEDKEGNKPKESKEQDKPKEVEEQDKTKEKEDDKKAAPVAAADLPQKTKGQQLKELLQQEKHPDVPKAKEEEKKAETIEAVADEPQKTKGQQLIELVHQKKQPAETKEAETKEAERTVEKKEEPGKTKGQQLKELLENAKSDKEEKKEEEVKIVKEAEKKPEQKAPEVVEPSKPESENIDVLVHNADTGSEESEEEWEEEIPSTITNQQPHFVDEILIGGGSAEHGVRFNYRYDIDRFWLQIDDPTISRISLSSQIAYVLGFADKDNVEANEIAKYAVDLKGGYNSFAVYATGLTRSVILGNSLSALLRIVALEGEYGNTIEKTYDHPMFIPVLPREINELEIELRLLDGNLVPFEFGQVMITLVFKKVINF